LAYGIVDGSDNLVVTSRLTSFWTSGPWFNFKLK